MTGRPWWHKTAHLRNKPNCVCEVQEKGHIVATKRRGRKTFLGTEHHALHHPDCPHSELKTTAKQLTAADKKLLAQQADTARRRFLMQAARQKSAEIRKTKGYKRPRK